MQRDLFYLIILKIILNLASKNFLIRFNFKTVHATCYSCNMEILFLGIISALLIAILYFVTKKDNSEEQNKDEYLIKGIVSEIIENEESQIYKLLNKSDQTVKEFLEKTGEIKSSISGVDQQTRNLISVLNNNQSRGQWAEFQVEDLLGIMDYKEGIHYETQKIMKSGTKPDFTFYLPDDKSINMDSKFPLTIYMEISKLNRDLEDETLDEIARREITDSIKAKTKEFLDKAIKTKIDDTASREGYIAPDEDTVDFVLMYIPLENLYHFLLTSVIGSSKTPVIEYAFSRKVILVSPQTLMAYLETIRHSMKLFSLQTDTKNILATHEKIKNEIRKFIDSFDDVTKRLDQTVQSFESLKTTRVNKLEKSFEELDQVNKQLED
ncbi:MAG: DNA recombination protein RmuC [Actinobacteria bacterium]|nr:DNA recombination protein RmuC [Actinomycetota bacterium]